MGQLACAKRPSLHAAWNCCTLFIRLGHTNRILLAFHSTGGIPVLFTDLQTQTPGRASVKFNTNIVFVVFYFGWNGGEDSCCGFLRYDTVYYGKRGPKFRINMLLPPSGMVLRKICIHFQGLNYFSPGDWRWRCDQQFVCSVFISTNTKQQTYASSVAWFNIASQCTFRVDVLDKAKTSHQWTRVSKWICSITLLCWRRSGAIFVCIYRTYSLSNCNSSDLYSGDPRSVHEVHLKARL
jgi:hypothetical protein